MCYLLRRYCWRIGYFYDDNVGGYSGHIYVERDIGQLCVIYSNCNITYLSVIVYLYEHSSWATYVILHPLNGISSTLGNLPTYFDLYQRLFVHAFLSTKLDLQHQEIRYCSSILDTTDASLYVNTKDASYPLTSLQQDSSSRR